MFNIKIPTTIKFTGPTSKNTQKGGLLIEGLVSLVLISLGALAVVGLQAHAIRIDGHAHYRHTATLVAADLANEMLLTKDKRTGKELNGLWSENLEKLPNGKVETKEVGSPPKNKLVMDIEVSWTPPNKKEGELDDVLRTRITIPKV